MTFRATITAVCSVLGLCLSCPLEARADIPTVPVGDPCNPADPGTGYGSVDYGYNIGVYEVTAGEYTEFLNAVADMDPYGLYNPDMSSTTSPEHGCNIQREGSGVTGDPYAYSVPQDWSEHPVNHVGWADAARFANWLHNGQPDGAVGPGTTEDGAYQLNGATINAELLAITREQDWRWALSNEDEWYKAAYYDANAGTYYTYPTGSNSVPTSEPPPGTDMVAGSANYDDNDYSDGWFDIALVGSYTAKPSDSPTGTYDQGGNVAEWVEATLNVDYRVVRGAAYDGGTWYMQSQHPFWAYPDDEDASFGFRVVQVPEPATISLLLAAAATLCSRPARRRRPTC